MILLAVLFWLTLEGSNVFSVWLQSGFDWLQRVLPKPVRAGRTGLRMR